MAGAVVVNPVLTAREFRMYDEQMPPTKPGSVLPVEATPSVPPQLLCVKR